MSCTSVLPPSEADDERATPYDQGQPIVPRPFLPAEGGGYASCIEDLLRFGHSTIETSAPVEPSAPQDSLNHTFFRDGWFNVGPLRVSNGNIRGANAHLVTHRATGTVVVCLTNATGHAADEAATEILEALRPTSSEEAARARRAYVERYRTPYEPTPELAGVWQGRIQTSTADIEVLLSLHDHGAGTLRLGGGEAQPLTHASYNEFGEFRAQTSGVLPLAQSGGEPQPIRVLLARENERLVGTMTGIFADESSSFMWPMFIEMSR